MAKGKSSHRKIDAHFNGHFKDGAWFSGFVFASGIFLGCREKG
jgi:hypothetical protein